jgi:pyruvate dehydrogenase E2 component (dihydrolipoamide acetyltransferase)
MSFEFKLPDLGEGIHEAEILAVKISPGQKVTEDEPIFEVETDKAVVEIPSPFSGTVEAVNVSVGQIVTVGSVMVTVRLDSPDKTELESSGIAKTGQAKTNEGEEKEPALSAVQAERSGSQSAASPLNLPTQKIDSSRSIAAMPATRRLARELGVDLRLVKATGSGGRVTNEDVRQFATIGKTAREDGQFPSLEKSVPLPDFSKYGPIERVPLRSVRRKTAENMTLSWKHIPQVTHFDEADVTALERMKSACEQEVQAKGGKLTLLAFVLKAVANSLSAYPQFNASFDEVKAEIILKRFVNLGVAVATDRGLIVPVIRNATEKSVTQLAIALTEIVAKTKARKVELDSLQGSTFTVTNVGSIGGTSMAPMVNYPEAAILAMAKAADKPVAKSGKVAVGLVMPLALSFDHRIADGAEAAYFMRHIVKQLEEPFTFAMEA